MVGAGLAITHSPLSADMAHNLMTDSTGFAAGITYNTVPKIQRDGSSGHDMLNRNT